MLPAPCSQRRIDQRPTWCAFGVLTLESEPFDPRL